MAAEPLFAKQHLEVTEAFKEAAAQFNHYSSLAPLATAKDALPIIQQAITAESQWVDMNSPDHMPYLRRQVLLFNELKSKLQAAGRKDLWPELEENADTDDKA